LQYGIHLATRLQSDDPGRQANWADIDDDDDDWAPESIEWTDGTKITLPQADEIMPSTAKTTSVTTVNEIARADSPKPSSPASQSSTAAPLKLGGMSSSSGRGLILKGAAEKPTLVAKPPGPPTPVKSPWAPLPPVDKSVPIATELQQQQQQQQLRFSQRDPHGFENMPPPPAKEIAADDFSRSWREGGSNINRELFDSKSGRYEPVNDNRKGSRSDVHSRQPALLQRPSQQDQQGPAEPSAAFQTHRATGQDGSYGRRRTSSTVSGGSGNLVRRMSKGQDMQSPHEMLHNRRGSLVAVTDSPSSPSLPSSSLHQLNQRGHSQQQWPGRASPSISHDSPASVHGQIATPGGGQPTGSIIPIEDEVELQKKIMRESRELARKRRLEEEAREEAERKERIRLKLEAMGPPPESKKNKKDATKEDKAAPTQIQARDGTSASTSPPKPPVTEYAGEVKQYGMMKVHPPDTLTESKLAKVDDVRPAQDNRPNGIYPSAAPNGNAEGQQASHETRQSQTWQSATSAGTDKYSSWASPATHPNQGRNVWGPPTSDRTLGNGTFNPELSQMAGSGPGPIGPPNSSRSNGQYQGRGREQFGGPRPGPIGPPQRQQATPREQQRAQANSAWNSLPEKLAQDARAREEQDKQDAARLELQATGIDTIQPQPIFKDTWKQVGVGEDGTRSGIKAISQTLNDGTSSTSSGWNDFPAQPAQDEGLERQRFDQQSESTWRQMDPNVAKMDIPQLAYMDTWRPVQPENGMRSEAFGSASAANNGSSSTASPPVRGSRFFPQSKDVRLEDPTVTFTRPGSPSPPPPTMVGHPAYDGDTVHPHVSLPRPPPIVRLPPPRVLAPIGPPKQITTFAAAVAAPAVPNLPANVTSSYQPKQTDDNSRYRNDQVGTTRPSHAASGAGDWQDRINHLIGRRSSPPKSHALAVDSSSKSALELPAAQKSATVSLPNSTSSDMSDDESLFETKPMAEECFEEQEMGSLPPIRVPNKAPETAWTLAPPAKPLPRKFVTEVTSANVLSFPVQVTNNGNTLHIFLPGMPEEKCVSVPLKTEPRQKSNSRRGGTRGGTTRHSSSNHPRGGRSRDTSSGFPSPGLEHSSISPSPTSSTRGGARGRGGFGSHWNNNRHVSTPSNAINV
jgi:hypothetical protein